MDYLHYKTLKFQRDGAVLTVTLNRPEALNAVNADTEPELARFFAEVAADEATRVIVLTGEGRAFSAGGDFTYLQKLIDDPNEHRKALALAKRVICAIVDCPKPVIAKINGHAVGFGATLALFCDVTFAVEHARIADPHVAIGLVAGDGGSIIWPQLVGYNRAKEYLFTGEPLLAPDAAKIGLINHAVAEGLIDAKVAEFAAKIAAMPVHALQWTKVSINLGLRQLVHSMLDATLAYEALSAGTNDHREAVAAIRDQRSPDFKGD